MTKPSRMHIKSLDRVLTIMRMHLVRQKVPKYRKEFIHDIKLIEQVKELVEDEINSPMFSALEDTNCELAW